MDDEARRIQREEIIPYWQGHSMRDRIFAEMKPAWKDAYEAGIFTEFMEQRAPGHTVLGDVIYRKGLLDLKQEVADSLGAPGFLQRPAGLGQAAGTASHGGGRRRRDPLRRTPRRNGAERWPRRKAIRARRAELEKIAEVCRHVPAHAPRDFREALQAYWFVHLGVITELNTWDSFSPGHLDQHLYPFYQRDLATARSTREQARELLECFWVKFNNQPAPPKVGVTAAESGTYTDFCNINTGGLKPDGSSGVNDLTYLILDVIDEMRLLQPSSNLQLSKKNPDRFLKRGLEIVRKGWGQPSIFNADMVVEELLRQGKSIEDARARRHFRLRGDRRVRQGGLYPDRLLQPAEGSGDHAEQRRAIRAPASRSASRPAIRASSSHYDDLFAAFRKQLRHFIDVKVRGNNVIERLYARTMPAPFLSLLVDDCIAKGRDYNDGGPRYNSTYIMGVAPGPAPTAWRPSSTTSSTSKTLTMAELLEALRGEFRGPREDAPAAVEQDAEVRQRRRLCRRPSWRRSSTRSSTTINGRPNTKGGDYRVNYLSTTCHVYFGSVTGATPDGRKAWEPLPTASRRRRAPTGTGPTAVIKSAARMDHARTGGTLLNQKFTPKLVEGEEGLDHLAHLVRSYFKLDGHHIQFNVVTAETLREAQAEPEKHRDLIVRVAGYSDYFCDLTRGAAERDHRAHRTNGLLNRAS